MCFSLKVPKYFEFILFLFAQYDNMEDCASVNKMINQRQIKMHCLTPFYFHLNLQN